jgi:phage terminase small subunit
MKKINGLTAKQRRFVQEYVIDCNATQAAVRAGYSHHNADKIGPRLVGNSRVSTAIDEALREAAEKARIKGEDVLKQLASIATSNITDILQWGDGRFWMKGSAEISAHAALAIQSVTFKSPEDGGGFSIKLHDKLKALALISHILNLHEGQAFGEKPKWHQELEAAMASLDRESL